MHLIILSLVACKVSALPQYTQSEVAKHNSINKGVWITYDGGYMILPSLLIYIQVEIKF
jgi:hypothetical protein